VVIEVTRRALNVLLRTERASEIPVVTGVTRRVVTTEASERKRGSCDGERELRRKERDGEGAT
jgi:hypothetical protein